LIGGLGNQMFQYAAGLGIAKATGRRLLLDRSLLDLGKGGRHYGLDIFKLQGEEVTHPSWRVHWTRRVGVLSRSRHAILRGLCSVAPTFGMQIVQDSKGGFQRRPYEVEGDILFKGYWQCWKYFENVVDEVRSSFQFPVEKASPGSREIESSIKETNSVAVHVRRGDYLRLQHVYHVCSQEYYQKAAVLIHGQVKDPVFFVFTEDAEWAAAHLKGLGDIRLVSNQREGAADWEDMWLMSHCANAIIPGSSFSWWGAWLAEKQRVVIAPNKWFVDEDQAFVNDLLPANWVRL